MTHTSFVSMWFSASLALGVFACDVFFFFSPEWKQFVIFISAFGALLALCGAFLLVESPIKLLTDGEQLRATSSLEYVKKFNRRGR